MAFALVLTYIRIAENLMRRIITTRRVWVSAIVVIVGSIVYLAVTGLAVRSQVNSARTQAAAISAGSNLSNPIQTADQIAKLRNTVHHAHSLVSGPIWWTASKIPFLGRTPTAVREVLSASDAIASATSNVETQLRTYHPSANRVADPELIAMIKTLTHDMSGPLNTYAPRVEALDLSGVPGVVANPSRTLQKQLNDGRELVNAGSDFIDVAPIILGLDKKRDWLLVFQSGAEARSIGGFPGGWGIATAAEGKITLGNLEANDAVATQPLQHVETLVSPDMLDLYHDDLTRLSDMNLSPDFPTNAKLMWTLYHQVKGVRTDGLIAMDEHALRDLMQVTGPVVVDGKTITSDQIVEYVTKTVYSDYPDPTKKDAALFSIISQVFSKLKSGELGIVSLSRALLPAITDARIKAWSSHPDEQKALEATSIGGSTANANNPSHIVVFANGAGNKIDAYVQADVKYTEGQCVPYVPFRASTIRLQLTNDAPKKGLPAYVTQRLDLGPVGTGQDGSTLMLTFVHVPIGAEFTSATIGKEPLSLVSSGTENGRQVWRFDIDLKAQSSNVVTITFNELATGSEPAPTLWTQPMARPMTVGVVPGPPCRLG